MWVDEVADWTESEQNLIAAVDVTVSLRAPYRRLIGVRLSKSTTLTAFTLPTSVKVNKILIFLSDGNHHTGCHDYLVTLSDCLLEFVQRLYYELGNFGSFTNV
jgi:hypothetical protein